MVRIKTNLVAVLLVSILFATGSRSLATDIDGDGLPDDWEMTHFGNLLQIETGDWEPDGLTNVQEFNKDTNPKVADTDGDDLNDGPEFNLHTTDPADADSDDDGLDDGAEVNTHHTNPNLADTDQDGLPDGAEISIHNTDPTEPDSDQDGFNDGLEISFGSNPNNPADTPNLTDLDNVVINELMAQNKSGLVDEDGDTSDWIELWNPRAVTVQIDDWHLTDDPDDPTKWTVPAHTMAPNSFLVIFASTKDRALPGAELHTSFALEKNGGYLALTRPDGTGGTEIVHHYDPYPANPEDVSFGLYGTAAPLPAGFFLIPTPHAANNANAVQGFVADTRFSIDRGFYETSQSVVITSATSGASIVYTTDSTVPTASPLNGTRVDAPDAFTPPSAAVLIRTTTVLRAYAIKDGFEPTNVDTQTYLFASDILHQSAPSEPFAHWGSSGPDWEMDSSVVNHADPASRCVADDLKEIPTLSLALPFANMWGNGGIYISGEGVEKNCSIEYLNPNGDPADTNTERGFQIDGTVQIVGGSSTGRWKSNHLSMRLKFTNGDLRADIFDKPWIPFGNEATDRFDTLVLDARLNQVWNHPDHNQRVRGQYVRDQFVADLQNALGGTAPHGRHMHVYIAGIYWGVHTVHERPDDNFAAEYFGGDNDDYDVLKHDPGTVLNGTNRRYNAIASQLNHDLTVESNYRGAAARIDLEGLARYMLVNYFCGNNDWDHHNWYASYKRTRPGSLLRFHSWDAEHVLKELHDDSTSTNNPGKPTGFHHRLMTSPEYKLIFADMVRREFYNGGHLTRGKVITHYLNRLDIIDEAIRAESARWGDNKRLGQPYLRGVEWLAERDRLVTTYFRTRIRDVPSQFNARGWYPGTDAPDFAQHGGNVSQDFPLTITSRDGGSIYYTLDGTDPRQAFTADPVGTAYDGPVTLASTGVLKARVRSNGGEWSAMTEALFVVGAAEADHTNLVVSEIHYRPASPSAEEIAAGYNERNAFEFLELMNVGPDPIDLSEVVFDDGIDFDFVSDSSIVELLPGQRLLIVEDPAAFEFRYGPGLPVAGTFQNATDLSNAGETIALRNTALGEAIQDFTFEDSAPWPSAPDGEEFSLTLICPEPGVDHADPRNWRASTALGGSPGSTDHEPLADWLTIHGLTPGQELTDLDLDGLKAIVEYAFGTNPDNPFDRDVLTARIQTLTVGSATEDYFVILFPRRKGTDDVTISAESSTDLVVWSDSGPVVSFTATADPAVELVGIRSPLPVSGSLQQFLRLRAVVK